MTTFFLFKTYLLEIQISMLFNVSSISGSTPQQYIVSANSWSDCSSYFEGTGQQINIISQFTQILMLNDMNSDSYYVALKTDTTGLMSNYLIFDTLSNILNWIDLQTGKSLNNIGYQPKTFISI